MIQTILCLSDTHNAHHRLSQLPEADVLVHCGDCTEYGTEEEALEFLQWFCDLPYRHKLFVPGNHDVCLHGATVEGLDPNCHILANSGITIEGVHFYGLPFFMEGFEDSLVHAIPSNVDVLISHQPPLGILDESDMEGKPIRYGSELLFLHIQRIRPSYCLFGHVHAGYGRLIAKNTTYVNAAIMNEDGTMNEPILLQINIPFQ